MLKGINLSKSFDYTLFSGLNLEFKPSTTTAILGVSGCGKSTLLHILSTLLKPDSGDVIYKDKSIYDLSSEELLNIRRFEFGIIFQSHYLFKGFSALENIEISTNLINQKIDYEIIEKLRISEILNQKVSDLSGGQQQRVSIARILCKRPKIIFADEPTGNLDKDTASDVMDAIFSYVKSTNGALVLITHDENLSHQCDSVYKLENKSLYNIK